MSDPFLGQIAMMAFGFAPRGYAKCDGGTLSLTQNAALYTLLGVAYGGDGKTTFGLPDLRGVSPIGALPSKDPSWNPGPYTLGAQAGTETVTLSMAQTPQHMHLLSASSAAATDGEAADGMALAAASAPLYAAPNPIVPLGGGPLGGNGGQPHPNMQPFLTIGMCIALTGIFPMRP